MGDSTLIQAGETKKPSPRVIALWRVQVVLRGASLAIAIVVAAALLDSLLPGMVIAGTVAAGTTFAAVVWPPALYRSWVFSVTASDVVIQRGVWWRVTSIVPHSRIQHVDTTHGPLERRLGLASLVLFTAGTVGASITIPGLPAPEADALRDQLAALGGEGESV